MYTNVQKCTLIYFNVNVNVNYKYNSCIFVYMATISLSMDRELTMFVQYQIISGIASSPEDYLRMLVKQQMLKYKNNKDIMEDVA